MKLKLAKQTLDSKSKEVSLDEVLKIILEKKVVFLDSDNNEDDIKKIVEKLDNHKVYVNTVRYGLAEDEYIYEVHIL